MKKNDKLVLIIVTVSVAVLAIAFASIKFLNSINPCSNSVLIQVTSPDDKYIATIYERDCGATTDFNRQVSVRESNSSFSDESKNIVFVVAGQPKLRLLWKTKNNLVISGAAALKNNTFTKKTLWRDIVISYQ